MFQENNDEKKIFSQYKELYFKIVGDCSIANVTKSGPSVAEGYLTNCGKFDHISDSISIPDLATERGSFAADRKLRTSVLDYIENLIVNSNFPCSGHIRKIGSCWDGSKAGNLDEVDVLFVLDRSTCDLTDVRYDESTHTYDFKLVHTLASCSTPNGRGISVRDFVDLFAKHLDRVLSENPCTELFEGGGYAAPDYSGVRINGPAVTILFQWKGDTSYSKGPGIISVDVTPAIPISCLKENTPAHEQKHLDAWIDEVASSLHNQPVKEDLQYHLVPLPVTNAWQPSTAWAESEILHELDSTCLLKYTFRITKLLIAKILNHCKEQKLFNLTENKIPEVDRLRKYLSHYHEKNEGISRDFLNGCMRYAHIMLSETERQYHHEMTKQAVSVNTTAVKHILLALARKTENMHMYTAKPVKAERVFQLMQDVVMELAQTTQCFVKHSMEAFPDIAKLSLMEAERQHLADIQNLYQSINKNLFNDVSIIFK